MKDSYSHKDLIKQNYSRLTKSERKIADFVLKQEYEVRHYTLKELANAIDTSEPSVIRFAKAIGYEGFSDFKKGVLQDWGRHTKDSSTSRLVDLTISKDDALSEIPSKIIQATIKGLNETYDLFDMDSYTEAVNAILAAKRIEIFGLGTSGSIAYDFVSRLIRIGLDAHAFQDNHLTQLSSASLTEDDLAIAISHSGSTIDAVDTLRIAKKAGAKTMVLTNYKTKHIIEYADIQLLTGEQETTFYSETMISRISLLSLVDMLYMGTLLSDYDNFTEHLHNINKLVEKKNFH